MACSIVRPIQKTTMNHNSARPRAVPRSSTGNSRQAVPMPMKT